LWAIFPKWGTYGSAAIVHDWLYWRQELRRDQADAVFLEAMTDSRLKPWKTPDSLPRRPLIRWRGVALDRPAAAPLGMSGTRLAGH
jgi:uncharacterized protein DUF1353